MSMHAANSFIFIKWNELNKELKCKKHQNQDGQRHIHIHGLQVAIGTSHTDEQLL